MEDPVPSSESRYCCAPCAEEGAVSCCSSSAEVVAAAVALVDAEAQADFHLFLLFLLFHPLSLSLYR